MKKYTMNQKWSGETAVRRMSAKALEAYNETDPCTVYAYDTEEGTRYDVVAGGTTVCEGLNFSDLNEYFEAIRDSWDEVDE